MYHFQNPSNGVPMVLRDEFDLASYDDAEVPGFIVEAVESDTCTPETAKAADRDAARMTRAARKVCGDIHEAAKFLRRQYGCDLT